MTTTTPDITFTRTVHPDSAVTFEAELRAPIAFAAGDVLRLVAVGGQVVSHVVHVVAHRTPAAPPAAATSAAAPGGAGDPSPGGTP